MSATVTAYTPITLANTAPADAEAELGAAVDAREELIELKNAVLEAPENPRLRYQLGTAYLQAGDGAAAEKELQRAIDLGLDEFPVRAKLAEAWIAQGRFQDVILDQDLKEALDTPNQAAVLTLYGKAELGRERLTAARERFEEALALTSDYAPAQLALARLELTEDNLGAAELLLARLEQGEAPDLAAINEVRGDLEMARGDFDGAEQAYRTALEAAPGRTDLMRDAAYAVMSRGEFEAAEAELEKVMRVSPNDGNALMMLAMAAFEQNDYGRAAEIAAGFTGSNQSAPLPLYIAGAASYFLGNPEQAQEYLSRYVARVPEDAAGRRVYAATLIDLGKGSDAYEQLAPLADQSENDAGLASLLGTAASMTGRPEAAADYFEQAVSLDPDNKQYRARLTTARLATGEREQGLAELEALARDPSVVGAKSILLRERLLSGEHDQAIALLDEVEAEQGANRQTRLLRARALLEQGDSDQAQRGLEAMLQEDPADLGALQLLSELLIQQGQFENAIAAAERAVAAQPDAVGPQVILSRIELQTNRGAAAVSRLEDLVARDPQAVDARALLINAYVSEHRLDEAQTLLNAAPEPEAPALLLARGRWELAAGRPNGAVRTFNQVLTRNPRDIDAHLGVAQALRANGDSAAARDAIDNAYNIAPKNQSVLFQRARLALTDLGAPQTVLQQGVAAYNSLREQVGDNLDIVFLGGYIELRRANTKKGLDLLRHAYENARSTDSLLGYSDALWAVGMRRTAMDTLETWLEIHPQDVRALLAKGNYFLMAGEYADAARELQQARTAGTDHAWIKAGLAYALAKSGDRRTAEALAREVLKRNDHDTMALNALGVVELGRGDAQGAVKRLQQAVDEGDVPAPVTLRLDYAEALAAAGDIPQARAIAEAVLSKLPAGSPFLSRAQRLSQR